ncbi:MAG: hypothetical protein IRZ21_06555 [Thermoleophilaceae bacterium]|nr:hypothetical protein [Thermoleophilaceae bacterium]
MRAERGWVAPEVSDEFPHLGLYVLAVEARAGRSPREVRGRLAAMSDRFTGGRAIQLRREPVPWAYRVFFRQIGLDPDERRTPPEQAALERMRAGGFVSRGLVEDALLIATVETGVALVALDAERVRPPLGIRLARPGERLGGDGIELPAGRIVMADERHVLAELFGKVAPGRGPGRRSRRLLIAAVRVKGVPEMSVEEAFWTVAEVLGQGR